LSRRKARHGRVEVLRSGYSPAEGFEAAKRSVLSLPMDENGEGLYDLDGRRENEEGCFSKRHPRIDLRKHLGRFPELVPRNSIGHLTVEVRDGGQPLDRPGHLIRT